MENLLNEVGMNLIVALIAGPILVAISGLLKMVWQRVFGVSGSTRPAASNGSANASQTPVATVLPWSDVAYAVVYATAMVGCVLLSIAITSRVFDLTSAFQWTLGSSVVAWGIYLVLSTVGGFLAQGMLSAGKLLDRDITESSTILHRRQVFAISLWTKLAFLLVFLGWAVLASSGAVFRPTIFGLVAFLVIDVLSAMALLLVE